MGVLARLFGWDRTADHPDDTVGGRTEAVADGGATNDHDRHPDSDTTGDIDVVDELVDRLRNDDLSDDQRAVLRRELGGLPRSHEVKFQHLQARVADFAAYSDAIEEFIDTNGTARDVLEELDDIEDRFADQIEDLEADLETAAQARTDLETRIDGLADDLEALDGLREDLATLENRLDELAETHEADVADLATAREDAVTELQHAQAELDRTHAEDVAALEDTVEERTTDLREELEALRAAADDLEKRWNRLEGVLASP
ncbi:MAG: hypothetical protein ABEJ57_02790 [Halobacteriaceae archaeon]